MKKPIYPLDLTKSTEELKKLIAENPDLPIVILCEADLCNGDYTYTYAPTVSFCIGELLDCETPWESEFVSTDREEFEERLEEWMWDNETQYDNDGKPHEPPEELFQDMLAEAKEKYESYWKKAIFIYAGT